MEKRFPQHGFEKSDFKSMIENIEYLRTNVTFSTLRLGNRTLEGTGSSKHTAKKIAAGTALIRLPESKMEMEQNFSAVQ